MKFRALKAFSYTPDHSSESVRVEKGRTVDGSSMPAEKLSRLIGLGCLAKKAEPKPKGKKPVESEGKKPAASTGG